MKIKFTYTVGRGPLKLHDQTAIIEIAGETITYERLHQAEQRFLASFSKKKRENCLIKWSSGPMDGNRQFSELK